MSTSSTINATNSFDDSLHSILMNASRPKTDDQVAAFTSSIEELTDTCAAKDDWKRLVLALLHKRYHIRAPEAKGEAMAKDATSTTETVATGDGERKLFYLAVKALLRKAVLEEQHQAGDDKAQTFKALQVVLDLAPNVGGSRDICTLLEDCIGDMIETTVTQQKKAMIELYGKESLGLLVRVALQECLVQFSRSAAYAQIEQKLVQVGADVLAVDLNIVRQAVDGAGSADETNQQDKKNQSLPSTLHVFLPHRSRGARNKNKKQKTSTPSSIPRRQIINCVAEILLWSRVPAAMDQNAFAKSYAMLLQATSDQELATKAMHTMQTIARKLRQELNNHARSQGFMLTNQFDLKGENGLDMAMIRRGKEGDVALLGKRAKTSLKVLRLINARFLSPAKVVQFSSLGELVAEWNATYDKEDEVAVLQREIMVARLKATISYLRKVTGDVGRGCVVASLAMDQVSNVATVLTAAAFGSWEIDINVTDAEQSTSTPMEGVTVTNATMSTVKTLLGGKEVQIGSVDSCVALLDEIMSDFKADEIDLPTMMDGESGVATTKAILNLLERHVADGETLIFVTQAMLELPEDVRRELTKRGCRVHCHDVDDMGARLDREKAQKGDITISLAWDTGDDLDLHVFLPSGEEISYSRSTSTCRLCCLDVDMNGGGAKSTEPVENVACGILDEQKEAPKGLYKVVVQNYSYHASQRGSSIPWRIVVEKNDKKETFSGECSGTGSKSDVVACTFEYNGRKVPWKTEDGKAFTKSNLVDVTTSTGQTIESLSNLVNVLKDQEHLDHVRVLAAGDGEEDPPEERPTEAQEGRLEVTSRDRVDILLSKLPARFHHTVNAAFGGSSLAEMCAKEVAARMVSDNVPLHELKRNGYPAEIIEAVKRNLAGSVATRG